MQILTCRDSVNLHPIGVKGNEEADTLCKEALYSDTIRGGGDTEWSESMGKTGGRERRQGEEWDKVYWGGIARQYKPTPPTPSVSRRRGHRGGGSTELGRKRHRGATATSNRSNSGGT